MMKVNAMTHYGAKFYSDFMINKIIMNSSARYCYAVEVSTVYVIPRVVVNYNHKEPALWGEILLCVKMIEGCTHTRIFKQRSR